MAEQEEGAPRPLRLRARAHLLRVELKTRMISRRQSAIRRSRAGVSSVQGYSPCNSKAPGPQTLPHHLATATTCAEARGPQPGVVRAPRPSWAGRLPSVEAVRPFLPSPRPAPSAPCKVRGAGSGLDGPMVSGELGSAKSSAAFAHPGCFRRRARERRPPCVPSLCAPSR
eukprot:scaffold14790_cov29-Tisochrysis_lutea.AAC.4